MFVRNDIHLFEAHAIYTLLFCIIGVVFVKVDYILETRIVISEYYHLYHMLQVCI